jgi:hypothetical protein
VLLAGDHPLVAVTAGEGLDPAAGIGGVEIGAAGDIGECVGGQQVALGVLGEWPQEAFLLLGCTVLDHRLQAQPGPQQGRGHADIHAG